MKRTTLLPLAVLVCSSASAQTDERPLPIIDTHFHAPLGTAPLDSAVQAFAGRIAVFDSLNVRFAVLNGVPDVLQAWWRLAPDRLLPALLFPCENGRAPNYGRRCFEDGGEFPDVDWIRREISEGRIGALGEITSQYLGMEPADPRLEPYFALAAETDIPVFLHMGLGPPGAAYESSPVPVKAPNFRAAAGNPLLLEEVLLRHRDLRVAVMHAGWPMVDEMIFILYQHPQVYVDVGALQYAVRRPEYHSYLKRLVEAGFEDRIMFGSDGGPGALKDGIAAIVDAGFLTQQQKRKILCDNAAEFLRLQPSPCGNGP